MTVGVVAKDSNISSEGDNWARDMSAQDAVFFAMIAMYQTTEMQILNRMETIEDRMKEMEKYQEWVRQLKAEANRADESGTDIDTSMAASETSEVPKVVHDEANGKVTITWGDYELTISKDKGGMVQLMKGDQEVFTVWGDPHVTLGKLDTSSGTNGDEIDFDWQEGNLTFYLEDGSKMTMSTMHVNPDDPKSWYVDEIAISTSTGHGFTTDLRDRDGNLVSKILINDMSAAEADKALHDGYELDLVWRNNHHGESGNDGYQVNLHSTGDFGTGKGVYSAYADVGGHERYLDDNTSVEVTSSEDQTYMDAVVDNLHSSETTPEWMKEAGFETAAEFWQHLEEELGLDIPWEEGSLSDAWLDDVIDAMNNKIEGYASVNQIDLLKLQRLLNLLNLITQACTSMEASKFQALRSVAQNL